MFWGLILIYASKQTLAADWTFTPALEVSQTYLDNVFLEQSGEEEFDHITQVNPELSLDVVGRRGNLNLDYRMQNVLYARNSEQNSVFNQLQADSNAEMIRDWFFIDADASFGQALISRTGGIGLDNNLSVTGNTTDVWRYTISPYLFRRLGRFVSTELRYTYGEVNFADESSSDSDNQRVFAWFGNNSANRRLALKYYRPERSSTTGRSSARRYSGLFDWSLIYDRVDSQAADDSDTKFEQVALDLGYRIGAETALVTALGYEDNTFDESSNGNGRTGSGFFWNVGVAWNPTIRTSLEARTGDRFFGQSYDLAARYRTRRMTANLLYVEEPINTSVSILQDPSSLNESNASTPSASGESQRTRVPLSDVSTEVFVRKRLTADISRSTAKSIFGIGFFNEERDYESFGDDERLYGADAAWDWRITSRMTSRLWGDWLRQDLRDGTDEDLWQISLRLTRKFSLDVDGFMEFRHGRRDSNIEENDYEQNQIAVGFNIQFGRSQLQRTPTDQQDGATTGNRIQF